jgi:chemotaxis protein methyltransferase CheR
MSQQPAADSLAEPSLAALRDQLAAYCGLYLNDTRLASLQSALVCLAQGAGCTPYQYGLMLRDGDTAGLQALAELLLNHETQFYRNRPQMAAFETILLPELDRALPPGAPLRLWSAGCSTGEEPYSLAMAVLTALGEPLPRPVEIWATDLSAPALDKARRGVYGGRSLANLTAEQRTRFFRPDGVALAVNDRVRRLVRFEQLNLLAPFPAGVGQFHAIFCQNVTIYFRVSSCRSLMERFYELITDGGLLFLGFSETLWKIYDRFRGRLAGGTFVYAKEPPPHLGPRSTGGARPLRRVVPTAPLAESAELAARGRALLNAGQAEAALELFASEPLVGAAAPHILALAARAHADRGELELAAAEAQRALELNPLTPEAHLLIGLIYARQGRPEAAIGQLERARYLDDGSPAVAFHLAECYRQLGRTANALREYRNTISRLADHPPDRLIDGVAAGWLSETCRHYEAKLSGRL